MCKRNASRAFAHRHHIRQRDLIEFPLNRPAGPLVNLVQDRLNVTAHRTSRQGTPGMRSKQDAALEGLQNISQQYPLRGEAESCAAMWTPLGSDQAGPGQFHQQPANHNGMGVNGTGEPGGGACLVRMFGEYRQHMNRKGKSTIMRHS